MTLATRFKQELDEVEQRYQTEVNAETREVERIAKFQRDGALTHEDLDRVDRAIPVALSRVRAEAAKRRDASISALRAEFDKEVDDLRATHGPLRHAIRKNVAAVADENTVQAMQRALKGAKSAADVRRLWDDAKGDNAARAWLEDHAQEHLPELAGHIWQREAEGLRYERGGAEAKRLAADENDIAGAFEVIRGHATSQEVLDFCHGIGIDVNDSLLTQQGVSRIGLAPAEAIGIEADAPLVDIAG